MAVNIKMINRCFHHVITRFPVQSEIFNKHLNLIQKSRNCSDCWFPKSINSVTYSSHFIQHTERFNNTNENLFKSKDFSSVPRIRCDGDFTHYGKYLNPRRKKHSCNLINSDDSYSTLFEKSPCNLVFTPFEPPKSSETQNLLHGNKNTLEYLKGLPKSFFRRRKNDDKKPKRRIPKLILLQNPFTWLMIKIDFSVLRNIWDPSFKEKEFKYGTKQAISRVTNVISEGQYSELNGLLTKAARLSLMRELDRNWSEKQRSLLALQNEDIQISSPRKVYFIRIADKKYCDVDMAFLALKWTPINSIDALIFTEIFARFHREYTPHCIPEWTIAYFKVTRFEVLRRKARTT